MNRCCCRCCRSCVIYQSWPCCSCNCCCCSLIQLVLCNTHGFCFCFCFFSMLATGYVRLSAGGGVANPLSARVWRNTVRVELSFVHATQFATHAASCRRSIWLPLRSFACSLACYQSKCLGSANWLCWPAQKEWGEQWQAERKRRWGKRGRKRGAEQQKELERDRARA